MANHDRSSSVKIVEQQVDFLVPGMEVAQDVCSEYGNVLLNQGAILNKHTIRKLQTWDISTVHIYAEVINNPIADPKIQQFVNSYNQSVSVVQKAFDEIRQSQEISAETLDKFQATADAITENVAVVGNIIDQLYNFPPCDDYTFRHSVNVSAISALIATWLKFPPDSINAISFAGLLHDIGKSQLPANLLNKTHRLSPQDYELYKQHTLFGHELVSKIPDVALSVLQAVADHHEREDGSGYPRNLAGEDIHPYAKIVAIADLYDEALTIKCDEPGSFSPYTSLERLHDEVYHLHAKTCITFSDNMKNFLSGNMVTLNDGRKGRVVFTNTETPSLSMVQLENGTVIDLRDIPDLRIHHVIR